MEKLIDNVKQWGGLIRRKDSAPELSSQYSLVSCGEEAVKVWLGLPDEIKYDPALAQFRKLYEKESGFSEQQQPHAATKSRTPKKRLPYVASAPHLNNNLHTVQEEDNRNNNNDGKGGLEIPAYRKDEGMEGEAIATVGEHKKQSLFEVLLHAVWMGLLELLVTQLARAGHCTKMTLLLGCWMFFTIVFMMCNEREEIHRLSSVRAGEIKEHVIRNSNQDFSLRLTLTGHFLTEQQEETKNTTEEPNMVHVWLERWTLNSPYSGHGIPDDILNIEKGGNWSLTLASIGKLDFAEGESRTNRLELYSTYPRNETSQEDAIYVLKMETEVNETVPLRMSYLENPIDRSTGVIYSSLLLCGLYVLIIFEVINRTMAAVVVSTTAIAVLSLAGERPSLPELVSWLDVETLLLLFSMMLLVAIMAETGMFDFLAVYTFEVTKGKMWPLINLLCAITALLSTFLDNVTTVLLMTPVTIRLCEVMELDPVPILMSMVLYSNIGGTATPVGDPPNVIIASNKDVVDSGINFTNFTMHMTVGIILVCLQTYFQLKFMYRDTNKLRLKVPREIQELRHQIAIWKRAADSLPHLSQDERVVKERLERKVRKLQLQLQQQIKETTKRACSKDTFHTTLAELKQKYHIRDVSLLIKCTVALAFVVTVFFLHSIPELKRVSLGWTALLGALLVLVLADREELEPVLLRVEWATLLFFAALFVLMEIMWFMMMTLVNAHTVKENIVMKLSHHKALAKLGLIDFIGEMTERLILAVDENARLAVALMLMLWVSGVCSAFVDNIPLSTMMVRVVTKLGSNPTLQLPLAPLVWALSLGACLGGNGTLIGASANVVCAGVAEQHGYKISFMQFFKVGFPVMIGHLIVASGYLLVCHCVFTWH